MPIRISLEKALTKIKEKIYRMFDITQESIWLSIQYLFEGKEDLLQKIKENEEKSDILNLDIQEECMSVLIRQQPVAKDARFVVAVMEISSFFERINDLSVEISELQPAKFNAELIKIRDYIMWMIQRIDHMIEVVEESLRTERINKIDKKLTEFDDDIDELFMKAHQILIDYLKSEKSKVEDAVKLLYVIRHLERIGDIVAKTGSRIIYIEKGKRVLIK